MPDRGEDGDAVSIAFRKGTVDYVELNFEFRPYTAPAGIVIRIVDVQRDLAYRGVQF
jgi:hypothetical protein